ncbi:RagB/SusD family nutrient uptake outer membrane protein [Sphingobacterium humi]|uniref:RagB/SusD family nutrient uptake outer membrane protein n=1 Tax=Sphingobacterium humi TaxID=1796905 RepID=A0A6N8L5P4_9SPHI|nr:RagB/SusD family nutrient uptake outer membrane protein [Sphingobacterium humi]MVZ63761.1 RagB/SusD family nutrient uptake outer membrane protein [Sphingobacterium humi]
MKKYNQILLVILCAVLLHGCDKSEFLDAKPRSTVEIPNTLEDLRALLDNIVVMNVTPNIGELSCDDYQLSYDFWQTVVSSKERNAYIWAEDIFEGSTGIQDWNIPYQQVHIANVVLEKLDEIEVTDKNRDEYRDVKASALFFRSLAFYNLLQLFSPPYDASSADSDMGVPLKLQADINSVTVRASVADSYGHLISDLQKSSAIINQEFPSVFIARPSKTAVLGLLARVHLSMREYASAELYADSCLMYHDDLIDFNTLDKSTNRPFSNTNQEVIFHSRCQLLTSFFFYGFSSFKVSEGLLSSYDSKDLRNVIYFLPDGRFKRIHIDLTTPFTGLTTGEMLLIRAECNVRKNNLTDALDDLNLLLLNRYETGEFTPMSSTSKEEVLTWVLEERRKELALKGLRWSDLRRLNKEGRAITLQREMNGIQYELKPNSRLYIFPIPSDEIALSGIPQNDRSNTTF